MHYSVMLNESIDGLNIKSDGIYVDCTLGYGGHSKEILKKLKTGHLYGFDQDKEALIYSNNLLSSINSNYTLIHDNFVNLKEDLGFSSPQIDNPNRGFSFMKDAKLDMRMNQDSDLTAYDVVNKYSEDKLINIFYKYGEEKYSKLIAKNIIKNRPINTTLELVSVIKSSVPYKYFNEHHPEREIFQAIRIEVNQELNVLESVLPDAIDLLNNGGRICVITFHSLEDRIVKQTFKEYSSVNSLVSGLRDEEIPDYLRPKIKLVNKHPYTASDKELKENSRSKSAKLRIVERI